MQDVELMSVLTGIRTMTVTTVAMVGHTDAGGEVVHMVTDFTVAAGAGALVAGVVAVEDVDVIAVAKKRKANPFRLVYALLVAKRATPFFIRSTRFGSIVV